MINPIIRQIIGRDCHVSLSNRTVIRHVISRLKEGYSTFRKMSRRERKLLLRDCIKAHRENWNLYVRVMGSKRKGRNKP